MYNDVNKSWAIQIDQPPILLTEENIKNWLVFRTDKLKKNQLYFWHATKFDWVPLWAGENEFLLTNFNKIKYDKINYTQFTKASWIKHNSVKPEAVKLLLKHFQLQTNTIDQMQPIINTTIQMDKLQQLVYHILWITMINHKTKFDLTIQTNTNGIQIDGLNQMGIDLVTNL